MQTTLPAYSGVKGATGGRYRGDSASGATEVQLLILSFRLCENIHITAQGVLLTYKARWLYFGQRMLQCIPVLPCARSRVDVQ
jgi:hypothetical protein